MFGYDVGISSGVTSIPNFLRKCFPHILAKINERGSGGIRWDHEGKYFWLFYFYDHFLFLHD